MKSMLLLMTLLLTSLTACTTAIVGDFCNVYTKVDMTGSEAKKLERKYQERILVNELLFEECKRKKAHIF